ncbi:hypothetical protein VPHD482_0270 [Vibrio phage D482]
MRSNSEIFLMEPMTLRVQRKRTLHLEVGTRVEIFGNGEVHRGDVVHIGSTVVCEGERKAFSFTHKIVQGEDVSINGHVRGHVFYGGDKHALEWKNGLPQISVVETFAEQIGVLDSVPVKVTGDEYVSQFEVVYYNDVAVCLRDPRSDELYVFYRGESTSTCEAATLEHVLS